MKLQTVLLTLTAIMLDLLNATINEVVFPNVTSVNNDNFINNVKYCEKLEKMLQPKEKRPVYIYGKPRNITIMWGARSPNRVAGALLLTALRHKLGYERVNLIAGQRTLKELAKFMPESGNWDYDEIIIHMGAENTNYEKTSLSCTAPLNVAFMSGSRIRSLGPPPVPISLQLHARLSTQAHNNSACLGANVWTWYKNLTATSKCNFYTNLPVNLHVSNKSIPTHCSSADHCIPVLVPYNSNQNITYEITQLVKNINETLIPYRIIPIPEEAYMRKFVEDNDSSFLFMDYDLWGKHSNVISVQPPLTEFKVEASRVVDTMMLKEKAPLVNTVVHRQCLNKKEMYDFLKLEATGLPVEEAACAHAINNIETFKSWAVADEEELFIVIFFCENVVDLQSYSLLLLEYLPKKYKNFKVNFFSIKTDCYDPYNLTQQLSIYIQKNPVFVKIIGLLVVGEGVTAASKYALETETLLVLYDIPSNNTQLNSAVRAAVGTSQSLIKAMIHFINSNGWKRIAAISDSSQIASDFVSHLSDEHDVIIGKRFVFPNSSNEKIIEQALKELRENNGRIFFVNTNTSTAKLVMCKALELRMTPASGFTWIVRKWDEGDIGCNYTEDMEHFTLTYSWQGTENDYLEKDKDITMLRQKIAQLWKNNVPSMIAPLTDAIILLVHTVATALSVYPHLRYDLHGEGATKLFSNAFMNSPAVGISQKLKQSQFTVDAPLVFVNVWKGMRRKLLAVWRVNNTKVEELQNFGKAYSDTPPQDGTRLCLHKYGDPFYPSCYDIYWAVLIVFLLLLPVAIYVARKVRKDALAAHYKSLRLRLLARCDHVAEALADHLIDRSALDLTTTLGSGHFGKVRSGLLKLPNKPRLTVAVKALRENASRTEEAEFLREACILATVSHENIIGFVGVCADNGPPLLLMKIAFFGDLLRYLYERRPLVQLEENESNADHSESKAVSAKELTRLAREAAEALAYLAEKRIVHRDVRAANCLVDEKRTLKLGDFGLARLISSNSSNSLAGDDKYVSKRHGVFPVPWMAPENLLDGVFSSASDVWALGVLMLEIVTLGERPYGDWKPPKILKFVYEGGHPPLPRDVTYHTSELLMWCWSILPEARPSARTVATRLRAQPTTLQPALRPTCRRCSWLKNPTELWISTL